MRCHQCGSNNPELNNFCGNCGARLEKTPAPVIAEPAVVNSSRSAATTVGVSDVDQSQPSWADPIKPAAYLRDEPLPEKPRSVIARDVERERLSEPTTISGPSFLGLADSSDDQSSYLLEDDQPRHRGGWFAFTVIALAIFIGIGYLEWNSIKTGRLNIPFLKTAESQPKPESTPAPTANQPPADANTNSANQAATNQPAAATPAAPQANTSASTPQPENTSGTPDKTPLGEPGAASASDSGPNKALDASAGSAPSSDSSAASTASESPSDSSAADKKHTAAAETGKDSSMTPKPQPKAKSSARVAAADTAPDPRQNKMLLSGEKYLYGRGVPQNCNQALVYFKAAAESGNAPAMAHLGAMYASGNCVTLNRPTAYTWFARAQSAQPEDAWLQKNMNILWRDMTPQERAAINK